MLIHHKFAADRLVKEMKMGLAAPIPAISVQEDDVAARRKHLWDVIVRMHFLAHELREPDIEGMAVSPEFTRLVSGLLREWAVLAEEGVRDLDAGESLQALRDAREHH